MLVNAPSLGLIKNTRVSETAAWESTFEIGRVTVGRTAPHMQQAALEDVRCVL